MPSDNIEQFKALAASAPDPSQVKHVLIAGVVVLPLVAYGFLASGSSVATMALQPSAAAGILMLYTVTGAVTVLVSKTLLPEQKPQWLHAYTLLSFLAVTVFTAVLSTANTPSQAWKIFVLANMAAYVISLLAMLLTGGYQNKYRKIFAAAAFPITWTATSYVLYMRNVPFVLKTSTLAEAAASLVLYAGVFALSDVMLKSNVGQLSVFDLTSGLFTSGTTEIDAGHKSRVPLHSLRFSSESGNGEVLVPWIHPGPIQGFGGFQLPSRIISYLNGNGEDGFMLHAPTTHRSDPAEEGVLEKIRDKSRGTTDLNLASKMVAAETSRFRFYARAYGSSEKESSKKVIFLEPKAGTEIDDYESAIFKKAVNFEDTVVVDLHNNPKAEHGEEVWEGTRTASEIVRGVKRIQSKVEECEMEGYKAGWSAGPDNECFSLVEEVGNQKVLIAGFNGNDLPGDEEIIQEGTREKFDDVLLFTTDSHESVQRLAQHNPYDTGSLRSAVEESEMSIAPTEVGFSYTDIGPVRLLKEDYSALVFSVNILIRFLPVALAAVYLSQLAMIATA